MNLERFQSAATGEVIANVSQHQARPKSKNFTPTNANATATQTAATLASIGERVSPLPLRAPPFTDQAAQNGRLTLSARRAPTPASITSGSLEKISMICLANTK